ncbi:MAG TPA: glycogen-binding domain-containing protein [Sedimentisphaerales bacterium]|nr:glycogen-binding domain-containing protein [Sedimentisphaerales bacterium]
MKKAKTVKKKIVRKAGAPRAAFKKKTAKEAAEMPAGAEAKAFDPGQIDEKIAQCCGVHQLEDAVMFVAFYPRAQTVEVAGEFNNWQPERNPMQKISENGVWQLKLPLPAGTYRYRLVVDGQWQQDPYNYATQVNPYGQPDSVLQVQQTAGKTAIGV